MPKCRLVCLLSCKLSAKLIADQQSLANLPVITWLLFPTNPTMEMRVNEIELSMCVRRLLKRGLGFLLIDILLRPQRLCARHRSVRSVSYNPTETTTGTYRTPNPISIKVTSWRRWLGREQASPLFCTCHSRKMSASRRTLARQGL